MATLIEKQNVQSTYNRIVKAVTEQDILEACSDFMFLAVETPDAVPQNLPHIIKSGNFSEEVGNWVQRVNTITYINSSACL